MPAYNFKSQFAPAVEAGTKLCTIRGRAATVGAKVLLYTGMQTKAQRLLGKGRIVGSSHITIGRNPEAFPFVIISGRQLRLTEITDPKWLQAMGAIGDSMHVSSTKPYIRFYELDTPSGQYMPINLDVAAI